MMTEKEIHAKTSDLLVDNIKSTINSFAWKDEADILNDFLGLSDQYEHLLIKYPDREKEARELIDPIANRIIEFIRIGLRAKFKEK